MYKYMRDNLKDDYEILELQDKIIETMQYIDSFMREHNITYYIFAGSVLGAIRHNGFIPWDDDFDIAMDNENYNKFIEACDKYLDKERYYLQKGNTKEYPNYYSKIRINNTTYLEEANKKNMHQGIFIDVFCLDNAPDKKISRIIQYYSAVFLKSEALSKFNYKTKNIKKKFIIILSKIIVRGNIKKILYNNVKKYNKIETKCYTDILSGTTRKNFYIPKEYFDRPKYVNYEKIKLPIPKESEKILKMQYGNDYMTPKIFLPHNKGWSTEMDYNEYLKKKQLVVLSISKLDNRQGAGVNINIPKYVKYLNRKCQSGYLDLGQEDLINLKDYKNYFKLKDLNRLSINELPIPFNNPDIVVFQDFYIFDFIKISKELKRRHIPYTIVPRGAMTKGAQHVKPIKKIIGNIVAFKKFAKNAKFIHFLTKNEYEESKSTFKFKNYVIIGNGIELPEQHYKVKNREEFKVTFIGRYNIFHKGLDVLFDAIILKQEEFRNKKIKFIFYGQDSANGFEQLKNIVKKEKLEDLIELNGTAFGEKKKKILLDTDVFIHTSRLEGHPTSVIEAISYGIPVLVTPGTNVSEDVKTNKLGFICELEPSSIGNALLKAYNEKTNFKAIMENELKYSKENYNWSIISENIIKYYSEIIYEGIK